MAVTCHGRRDAAGVLIALILLAAPDVVHGRLLRVIDDPRFEQGGEFGGALAAVGGDLAVGAPGARVFDQDRAGLVRLIGTDGVLRHTFEARTAVTDAAFGSMAVASDGLLYVSAPGDRSIGLAGIGAIYVFDVATGALVRIIRAPDADANTLPVGGVPTASGIPPSTAPSPEARGFGRGLAVAGDRILVGAPDSVVDGLAGAGAVYLFDTQQGTLIRTLREFSPHAGASFGASLAVVGDVLFVGAPGAPAGGVDGAGVVRVFDSGTGRSLQTLRSGIPVGGAAFGAVVGEVDGALFVGAPGDPALGVDGAGAVYLFDTDAMGLRRILTAPQTLGFGRAVAVLDGNLLVGADGGGLEQSGQAFLIDPVTSAIRATFAPPIARQGGRFSFALGIVGTAIAIGEPAPEVTSGSGRVSLFDLATGTPGTGPSRVQGSAAAQAAPLPATCPQAPTTPSLDCRLNALLRTVAGTGVQDLARPLRHVRRAVQRADSTRGKRRAQAFRRALHGIGDFMGRLEDSPGVSADLRDTLLADASSVKADLDGLLGSTAP